MTVLNLTQHDATPSQEEAGVVEAPPHRRRTIRHLLTIDQIPTAEEIQRRAESLAEIAADAGHPEAMIGGAGPLMRALRVALKRWGITPREAFAKREVTEVTEPDGRVVKTAVFVHAGWWPDVD